MSGLSSLRTELAADLTAAGIKAFDYVPGKVAPPVAIVTAADPYVERSDRLSATEFKASFSVWCLAGPATSSVSTGALDDLLERVLAAIPSWQLEGIGKPQVDSTYDNGYLAADVSISTYFTIDPS